MKTAILTGAAGGIGSAIALRLAKDGAFVVLVGRTASTLQVVADRITALPSHAGVAVSVLDVTDPDAVEKFYRETVPPDILVNTAAGAAVIAPITQTSYADWMNTIQSDLTSTFLMCRGAANAMMPLGSGRIVNMASYHALGSYPNRSAYAAAKGGVVALTQQLAVELGPYHITVNAISPGAILTPRTRGFLATDHKIQGRLIQRTPLGRLGTPDDVADTVAWLVGDGAQHVTGQNIIVDGGYQVCLSPLS